MITGTQLKQVAPHCPQPEDWARLLTTVMEEFGITEEAAFIAQACHESQEFTRLSENLNYSPTGLLATWPTRFTPTRAAAYARKPQAIANYVYANRMGNGDESSGEGWKYRGRGLPQITGKDNYRAIGKALRLDLVENPDLLLMMENACAAYGVYWVMNGFNSIKPMDERGFYSLSQKINGTAGKPNGWAERLNYFNQLKELICQQ